MNASEVIISPIVSEKSFVLSSAGKYTFRVHPDSHKTQIRQAIEELFEVKVVSVHTQNLKGKPKQRAGIRGRTRNWKKAIVQLAPGERIEVALDFPAERASAGALVCSPQPFLGGGPNLVDQCLAQTEQLMLIFQQRLGKLALPCFRSTRLCRGQHGGAQRRGDSSQLDLVRHQSLL